MVGPKQLQSKSITPASGGTLEDTTSGVKLTIPANALGSSTSSGNIEAKETNNIRSTDSATPLGGKAKEIKATDSSGNPITTLNSSVTVEMNYTKAELAATASADDSSINTKTESDKLQMAYWDDANSNWVTLPSTLTYLDSSGAMITTPAADLSGVASVTVKANTTHFSLYAPIVATNPSAPLTPSGLAATAASTSQVSLSWTQTSGATGYDIYRSTSLTGTYSRVGSEPTVSSGSTVSYSDTNGLSSGTAYYYKITALNASGESTSSSAVSVTTLTSSGGGYSSNSSPTVVADTTPPTNTSVSIAAGALKTTTKSVALILAATSASQMMISNASDFANATWESYATSKTWTLTSGNGTKTVYAKFRDLALNVSTAVTDTITLEEATATPTATTTTVPTTTTTTTTVATAATTVPTAPVIIPALPPVPTTTDIQTVLVKVAEQVAYIQANLTATNALSLLADVAQRLSQLQTSISSVASTAVSTLTRPLQTGSQNADVTTLQSFLKSQGSEVYPEGLVTGYFGAKTEAAVGRFQVKHGLVADSSDPAYGYVGPATRAKINSLLGL